MFTLISIVRPKNIKNLEMVFSAFITSNPVYQIIDSCIKFCNNVKRSGKGNPLKRVGSIDVTRLIFADTCNRLII